MPRSLFLADDLRPDRVVLAGPEGRHAATVRRLRVGDPVDLTDGRGTRASCVVQAVARGTVELEVRNRSIEPRPSARLVLVQALAKGDRGELAVELATEIGVDEIVPWAAQRCVVRWDGERGTRALARWRSTAREAAKQSRRAWVPEVTQAVTTGQLVERLSGAATAFVLHESASLPLTTVPVARQGELVLVVGPEGGLSDAKVQRLQAAGASAVRLGRSVLRTSTAGAAAAVVISSRTGRWD